MNNRIIRNIWAVGRNYKKHAEELGNSVPQTPLIFLKAGSCIQASKDSLVFPEWVKDLHFELEVALQLDASLQPSKIALAIDFTERTLQSQLKEKGHPWTLAKSFSGACTITEWKPLSDLKLLENVTFELKLNGKTRQKGHTGDMIFDAPTIVSYVKHHFPVCPRDVILTGTPEGVGSVEDSDILEVALPSFEIQQTWSVHSSPKDHSTPNTRNGSPHVK